MRCSSVGRALVNAARDFFVPFNIWMLLMLLVLMGRLSAFALSHVGRLFNVAFGLNEVTIECLRNLVNFSIVFFFGENLHNEDMQSNVLR